jgi:hypothetical protein
MIENIHKNAAAGRWYKMSLSEQMGNIGSEVGRAINWEKKGNLIQRDRALDRAFDLFDITLDDDRWKDFSGRLKEICRAREILADTFWGNRFYGDTPEKLEKYFFQFAVAARSER